MGRDRLCLGNHRPVSSDPAMAPDGDRRLVMGVQGFHARSMDVGEQALAGLEEDDEGAFALASARVSSAPTRPTWNGSRTASRSTVSALPVVPHSPHTRISNSRWSCFATLSTLPEDVGMARASHDHGHKGHLVVGCHLPDAAPTDGARTVMIMA